MKTKSDESQPVTKLQISTALAGGTHSLAHWTVSAQSCSWQQIKNIGTSNHHKAGRSLPVHLKDRTQCTFYVTHLFLNYIDGSHSVQSTMQLYS